MDNTVNMRRPHPPISLGDILLSGVLLANVPRGPLVLLHQIRPKLMHILPLVTTGVYRA